jgi:hypothetical protein
LGRRYPAPVNDYRDLPLEVARRAAALARDAPGADEDARIRAWWAAPTWMTPRSWWAIGLAENEKGSDLFFRRSVDGKNGAREVREHFV